MNIVIVRQIEVLKSPWIVSLIEMTKALNERGHNAVLIGMGDNKDNRRKYIRLIKPPFNRGSLFRLKLIFYLPVYVITKKVDIVIVDRTTVFVALFTNFFKKFLNVKIIIDVRSVPVETNGQQAGFEKAMKMSNRFLDGATFITEGTEEFIRTKYRLNFKKTALWSSGVNLKIFDNKVIPVNGIIKQKTNGKFVIFYHGSISPNRGVYSVLKAVNELKKDIPGLLFISVSRDNDYIRDFCGMNNLSLDNNLLLLNAIDNALLPAYIMHADLCIVPLPRLKWWEISSPLKLMEYLAMGKPLILSDIKAHLNVIPPESKYAVYYNPDKENDLAEKIYYAYKNISTLKTYASKGRDLVSKSFTWDIQAQKLEEFLTAI